MWWIHLFRILSDHCCIWFFVSCPLSLSLVLVCVLFGSLMFSLYISFFSCSYMSSFSCWVIRVFVYSLILFSVLSEIQSPIYVIVMMFFVLSFLDVSQITSCMCMRTYTYLYICTDTFTYTYTSSRTHAHIHIHAHIYLCICVYMHVYM